MASGPPNSSSASGEMTVQSRRKVRLVFTCTSDYVHPHNSRATLCVCRLPQLLRMLLNAQLRTRYDTHEHMLRYTRTHTAGLKTAQAKDSRAGESSRALPQVVRVVAGSCRRAHLLEAHDVGRGELIRQQRVQQARRVQRHLGQIAQAQVLIRRLFFLTDALPFSCDGIYCCHRNTVL